MSNVISACTTFFLYAVIAIFAQNAVLARGMGVSRVVQLVGDNDTSSLLFGLELSVICMLDAPLAWLLRRAVEQCSFRSLVRPLAYVLCSAVVCGVMSFSMVSGCISKLCARSVGTRTAVPSQYATCAT